MKRLPKGKVKTNNPKKEWLEKAYPGPLHLIFMQGIHGGVYTMNKLYPFGFKSGYSIQKGLMFDWFWDNRELTRVRNLFLEKCKKDLRFFMILYNRWEKDHDYNLSVYEEVEGMDYSELSDKELFEVYKKIYHANLRQAGSGYLADCFLSSGESDWLSDFIISRLDVKDKKKIYEIITILTAPTIPSYSNEEMISLSKISDDVKKKDNFNEFYESLKKDKKNWERLCSHKERYYWVENSYFPKVLSVKDFAKKLFNGSFEDYIHVFVENNEKREKLLKTIGDDYLNRVIKMSSLMTHIQDYRKMGIVRFAHFFDLIIKEMAKRMGINFELLYHTVEPEIKYIFLKKTFDLKKLKLRSKKNFVYGTPKGYAVYEGKDYDKYLDESDFIEELGDVDVIEGVTACSGLVEGVVRVVRDPKGCGFKKGEILVTNQTTPDFVPIMNKAAAIVTEQGGITAHAAVISRELGIPCVIGTKIATKVLKDGDLVEVDASNGKVRKV